MRIFNGGVINLADIELLTADDLRARVVDACSNGGRLVNFFASPVEDALCLFAVLAYEDDPELEVISARIDKNNARYSALTPQLAQASSFEREIAEQWAIMPQGHPWLKPLRYHKNYRGISDIWPDVDGRVIPGSYEFYSMHGEDAHELAVGPVHAGIIEPGHFRFQCYGERILHLEIQLGYQHRGIEPMFLANDPQRSALLSESIAGDTSIGHSTAFCELMEALSGCRISARAQAIRAAALELERLANHVGDLGALSGDVGFLPVSSYCGRMRGDYLNLLLLLTGNRFGKGLCRPGGVLFDIDDQMTKEICRKLLIYKKDFEQVSDLLFTRPSAMARFEGVGVISEDTARQLGMVGPAARACGLERDARIDHACGAWQFYHVPISLGVSGDVYARALVRRQEVSRSLEFLLKLIPNLPKGQIFTPCPSLRAGSFALSVVEGWRGEIMHTAMTDKQGRLIRYKVKDPSFHNWPALAFAIRDEELSDFPLCNKSFNLSYCGHDL